MSYKPENFYFRRKYKEPVCISPFELHQNRLKRISESTNTALKSSISVNKNMNKYKEFLIKNKYKAKLVQFGDVNKENSRLQSMLDETARKKPKMSNSKIDTSVLARTMTTNMSSVRYLRQQSIQQENEMIVKPLLEAKTKYSLQKQQQSFEKLIKAKSLRSLPIKDLVSLDQSKINGYLYEQNSNLTYQRPRRQVFSPDETQYLSSPLSLKSFMSPLKSFNSSHGHTFKRQEPLY